MGMAYVACGPIGSPATMAVLAMETIELKQFREHGPVAVSISASAIFTVIIYNFAFGALKFRD